MLPSNESVPSEQFPTLVPNVPQTLSLRPCLRKLCSKKDLKLCSRLIPRASVLPPALAFCRYVTALKTVRASTQGVCVAFLPPECGAGHQMGDSSTALWAVLPASSSKRYQGVRFTQLPSQVSKAGERPRLLAVSGQWVPNAPHAPWQHYPNYMHTPACATKPKPLCTIFTWIAASALSFWA